MTTHELHFRGGRWDGLMLEIDRYPWPYMTIGHRADAPASPIARGWVTTDDRGRVVISPALAAKLRKP